MTRTRLQDCKKDIKRLLGILPYGLGGELLRMYAFVKYCRWRVSGYGKLRGERRESQRILSDLRLGRISKVLVVYDNLASPPTYGDYFFVVMLARYFTSQGIPVSFVIVDGEYRNDWLTLNGSEKRQLVANYVEMASTLLAPDLATIEVLVWPQLAARIRESSGVEVPFRDSVLNRAHVYGHVLNTLNYLCAQAGQEHLDRFLLSFDELAPKVAIRKPDRPYVTWNCRYSSKWSFERNASVEEFVEIHARLQSLYPHHAIMIVSDADGCDRFREMARQHGLQCLFSKDYSETLLGDGVLILGSAYFYMLRGGGIAVFPMFSRVPHERITVTSGEVPWTNGRATSWASENQVFKHPDLARTLLPTLAVTASPRGKGNAPGPTPP